jgi:hypothetical protein
MLYFDTETHNITTDEDLAIALTGTNVVTNEVDCAAAELVIAGILEPMPLSEAA